MFRNIFFEYLKKKLENVNLKKCFHSMNHVIFEVILSLTIISVTNDMFASSLIFLSLDVCGCEDFSKKKVGFISFRLS